MKPPKRWTSQTDEQMKKLFPKWKERVRAVGDPDNIVNRSGEAGRTAGRSMKSPGVSRGVQGCNC